MTVALAGDSYYVSALDHYVVWSKAKFKQRFFTSDGTTKARRLVHVARLDGGLMRTTSRDGQVLEVRFFPKYYCQASLVHPVTISDDELLDCGRSLCRVCVAFAENEEATA